MLLVGMAELNNMLGVWVFMVNICAALLNRFVWLDQFSDVDSCSTGRSLQLINELLQIVLEVVTLFELLAEFLYCFGLLGFFCLLCFFFLFLFCAVLHVHFAAFQDLGTLLDLRIGSLLDMRVVQEPLGQEVNRVFGVRLVSHCHAL